MKTLLNNVKNVLQALIGSTVYDDPAGGTQAMRYYVGQMPDKRDSGNEQDFPFCLIEPGLVTLSRDGRRHVVDITFGLFEAGTKDDAITMVDSFLSVIAAAPTQNYSGYKLLGEMTAEIEKNHPYYEISLTGEFRKAR